MFKDTRPPPNIDDPWLVNPRGIKIQVPKHRVDKLLARGYQLAEEEEKEESPQPRPAEAAPPKPTKPKKVKLTSVARQGRPPTRKRPSKNLELEAL
jgi:hypothetical protein